MLLQFFLYSFLFWFFAPQFRYAFGPDFTSYSSIAKNYAAGHFSSAVNTWWSPAYSWLLAVFSVFSKDVLTANQLLQFCAGIPALFLVRNIIFFHSPLKRDLYAECCVLAFTPILALWALKSDTPDFCGAVVLLWFFFEVLKLLQHFSKRTALLTGSAGALAYLFKSYNFYFITAIGLFLFVWELVVNRKKRTILFHQWKWTAGSFLFISSVWILIISLKHHQPVVSTVGWHQPCTNEYVLQLKPVAAVCDCAGLQFDAANRISNWETPGSYPGSSLKKILGSEQNNGSAFIRNAGYFFSSFVSRYQILLMAVFLVLLWGFWRKNGYVYAAFWGIYCGGYFLFHLEPRFFIMPSLLLMIGISISFLRITETFKNAWLNRLGLLLLMILFMHSYLYNLWKFEVVTVPKNVYQFAQKQTNNFEQKNIAAAAGLYDEGLYFSFFKNSRFYGSLTARANDSASVAALQKNKIDYLLTRDEQGNYGLVPVAAGILP